MFYFKKIYSSVTDRMQLENALRKAALKKNRPLDFDISSMDMGTDKYFFGYEGKNSLQFTRIRTSFERIIPKLIIRLPIDKDAVYYEIRFGVFSAMWVAFMSLFVFIWLASAVIHTEMFDGLPQLIIILGIQTLVYLLEFRLTTSRVEKAIRKYLDTVI